MAHLVLVMGVSGVGKTTVGEGLAAALGGRFFDADDFHPPENVTKMRRGEPLNDEDRRGWLDRLHALLVERAAAPEPTVLACSALKDTYRHRLAEGLDGQLRVVYLKADFATIEKRMLDRQGHFMPAKLLRSQFDALEEPTGAVVVDALLPRDEVVSAAVRAIGAAPAAGR